MSPADPPRCGGRLSGSADLGPRLHALHPREVQGFYDTEGISLD